MLVIAIDEASRNTLVMKAIERLWPCRHPHIQLHDYILVSSPQGSIFPAAREKRNILGRLVPALTRSIIFPSYYPHTYSPSRSPSPSSSELSHFACPFPSISSHLPLQRGQSVRSSCFIQRCAAGLPQSPHAVVCPCYATSRRGCFHCRRRDHCAGGSHLHTTFVTP